MKEARNRFLAIFLAPLLPRPPVGHHQAPPAVTFLPAGGSLTPAPRVWRCSPWMNPMRPSIGRAPPSRRLRTCVQSSMPSSGIPVRCCSALEALLRNSVQASMTSRECTRSMPRRCADSAACFVRTMSLRHGRPTTPRQWPPHRSIARSPTSASSVIGLAARLVRRAQSLGVPPPRCRRGPTSHGHCSTSLRPCHLRPLSTAPLLALPPPAAAVTRRGFPRRRPRSTSQCP